MKLSSRIARRNTKGQSMVEFALMLPLLLGIMIGLALFSLIFFSYVTMQLAVREGARAIVGDPTHQTVAGIQALVKGKTFSLDQSQMDVTVYPDDTGLWTSGVPVSVSAYYTVPIPNLRIPLAQGGAFQFAPIRISAISQMNIE